MHILYVDDSGHVENPDERYFVLGGVSIFERSIYHLIKAVDDCVAAFGLGPGDDIELHGSPMYSGRGALWRSIRERAQRERMINDALYCLQHNSGVRLFAVAVDKAAVAPEDPVSLAFEELCNRFNLFLQRNYHRTNEAHRGLIIMDETKHEQPLQALSRHFRVNGGRWGSYRNLAEVPLFVDSRASRLVQLADLVAYATWRRYEFLDGRFFEPLIPKFDADGGVIHGLVHRRDVKEGDCYCPSCQSRRRDQR
ncbi:DUF3800 domain-containing protein [Rhizobium sp. SAFR-030]|uniref:DUF3800 domain-containing protein n=1 Tax=Rhizobium sp. SAFR-030 TaxID=3387277 RepID=UPI003F7D64CC